MWKLGALNLYPDSSFLTSLVIYIFAMYYLCFRWIFSLSLYTTMSIYNLSFDIVVVTWVFRHPQPLVFYAIPFTFNDPDYCWKGGKSQISFSSSPLLWNALHFHQFSLPKCRWKSEEREGGVADLRSGSVWLPGTREWHNLHSATRSGIHDANDRAQFPYFLATWISKCDKLWLFWTGDGRSPWETGNLIETLATFFNLM